MSMTETAINNAMEGTGLKVGVVGIGNAGGQVALAAANRGVGVYVLNTSIKDLDNAVLGEQINGFQIGDGRGSGKNRENALELLKTLGKEGIASIFSNPYFVGVVDKADIVFVTFSTGGGTGSGIGPTFSKMLHSAYANKVIIPIGILPKNAESLQAQSNTIACVNEIDALGIPYMLADLGYYEDVDQEKSFEQIGKWVADAICAIRGDYLKMSAHGMADERDVLTVISEPGYMTVHMKTGITEPMLEKKTLQGYLVDQVKSSPACRIQKDGLIQYSLLISNVNSSIADPMKVGDYSELNTFVGEPKATFANYSVDDMVNEFQVIAISSGLSIPKDRFATASARLRENKEKFEKRTALSLAQDAAELALKGNAATKSIIMKSGESSGPNMDFLNDFI